MHLARNWLSGSIQRNIYLHLIVHCSGGSFQSALLLFLVPIEHKGKMCREVWRLSGEISQSDYPDSDIAWPGFCCLKRSPGSFMCLFWQKKPIFSCHCHFYTTTKLIIPKFLRNGCLFLFTGLLESWGMMHLSLLQLVRYLEISQDNISYSCWSWPECKYKMRVRGGNVVVVWMACDLSILLSP